eukprot:CAMPEP_0116878556 /NCGR_PEP_ID=MMETSP0463-20121206/10305_1 /TAXON_ID=181622 /ORGANISM="Strombidinopsis sp, Strain SopsisLIS2011" /LENGTH=50 /DNA_ID=CAMNT_0004526893 /DNA_START=11 /DNA_END=163 /DNA_ORIENTATION=+
MADETSTNSTTVAVDPQFDECWQRYQKAISEKNNNAYALIMALNEVINNS